MSNTENLNQNLGVWVPDLGDGTYKNPIIYADYSDPDIVRVGDDFYMISSSFNCTPGMPVLHSKDLVNWKIVNYICKDIPLTGYDKPQHGKGIWAPSIKYHAGKVWVYVCTPDEGLFMSNTEDPAGEWSPLVHVKKVVGWIDSCPFWDEDGQGYLLHAFANSRVGLSSLLHLCKLSEDGTEIIDKGKIIIDVVDRHHVMEGPKMFKRNGYYYVSAPAGGIEHGYQVTMRSKNIYGPYEERIAIHEGDNSINGPRQGGFVDLDCGETWFAHFQDLEAYGRVVNLQPVKWVDDWMIIGEDVDGDGIGEPLEICKKPNVGSTYPIEVPQTSDEFEAEKLGLQWQWHANPKKEWYSLTDKKGFMRLYASNLPEGGKTLFDASNLLLQKLPAPEFEFTTKLVFSPDKDSDIAGLMISGMEYCYLSLTKIAEGFKVSCIKGTGDLENREEVELGNVKLTVEKDAEVYLKVSVNKGAVCSFSCSKDGVNFESIGEQFQAVAGRWIGAKVGIFCINKAEHSKGYADFDWVRVGK
jgi:beta-xylosidase